jgi:oligopeptide/dipeptide ABC transporter ATP-binding protein
MTEPILSVKKLTKIFTKDEPDDNLLPGFYDITFDLYPGETIGLVGESGCGKTTLARTLLRLLNPDTGQIILNGQEFSSMKGLQVRRFRKNIQIVFQKPETSLNPRMTVKKFVSEAINNYNTVKKDKIEHKLVELTGLVGLTADHLNRFPHQLSGGEKQRVGIMRALACEPLLIVLDEPTSALDVSVQAQVLQTLKFVQESTRTAFILISHDIAVIRYMCSKVYVMYLGKIIEDGPNPSIFDDPRHPYTRALFDAVPRLSGDKDVRVILTGEAGIKEVKADSCPLLPRCPFVMEKCKEMPPNITIANDRKVSCWLEQK